MDEVEFHAIIAAIAMSGLRFGTPFDMVVNALPTVRSPESC
jgi:hypothetical protein